MKFTNLIIENFGTIEKAAVTLNDRGLVLIQGQNDDDPSANSNGAGKSTIVEALSWVLYGKTAKGISGDAVVNRRIGKGTCVAVEIIDDQARYEIKRYRKHPKGKNALTVHKHAVNPPLMDLTKGTDKLTQEVVDQIMGCSYDVFVAAVYAGQEAIPDIPAMTDKELKLLIEEAAGITIFDEAYVIARQRLAEHQRNVETCTRQIETADQKIDAEKQRAEDAKEAQRTWLTERDARIIDHETTARGHIVDAQALQKKLSEMTPQAKLDTELASVQNALGRLNDEKAKLTRLEQASTAAQSAAAAEKRTAENMVATIKQKREALDHLRTAHTEPCKTCGRPHDPASFKESIAQAEKELEQLTQTAREALASAQSASESARIAHTDAESYRASMTDPSHAMSVRDEILTSVQHREKVASKIEELKQQAQRSLDAIKKERAATNPHDAKIAEREQAVADAKKARDALTPLMTATLKAKAVAAGVVEVYSPRGVRAHILDTVTPYLNDRTAIYLGSLADGRIEAIWQTLTPTAKGELREKFTIDVTHADGGEGFATLSGGEKRKVRVACALALQDLVGTRATKPIDLWIGDEIDAALDAAGLERLMNVLEDKARERGSVFVISHSDLRDWIRETITVVKSGGVSTLKAA